MRIDTLYFAVLRERLGRERETMELPEGASVSDLLSKVCAAHPALPPLLGRVQVAVNRQIVPSAHTLADGDEVALIPPVAGGAGPARIEVTSAPLSLGSVVALVEGPGRGAVATFSGYVRDHGALPDVIRLEYEAYVPMAVEVLAALADEIELESPGVRIAIHHRIGTLAVGEAAVVIAAAAPHRAEAFAACRIAIERLKQRAPIWKKEIGASGAVWVGSGP